MRKLKDKEFNFLSHNQSMTDQTTNPHNLKSEPEILIAKVYFPLKKHVIVETEPISITSELGDLGQVT